MIVFITVIILLVILNTLGVKNPPRKGDRSGQIRAQRQLRRMKRGKWF